MNAQTPFVSLYDNLSTGDLSLIAHRLGADSSTHARRADAVTLLAEVHRLRLAVALVRGYYDDLLDAVRSALSALPGDDTGTERLGYETDDAVVDPDRPVGYRLTHAAERLLARSSGTRS
jgi:hypothetical protein